MERETWLSLMQRWSQALKRAKTQQAIIDDKMASYLRGIGEMPSSCDLEKVASLWKQHAEYRDASNAFIAKTIQKQFPDTDKTTA